MGIARALVESVVVNGIRGSEECGYRVAQAWLSCKGEESEKSR